MRGIPETYALPHRRPGMAGLLLTAPTLVLAQASPFMTGATALQTNILAWLTPIAIILVMALGAMAMANRMSWGWCLGAILGNWWIAPGLLGWLPGLVLGFVPYLYLLQKRKRRSRRFAELHPEAIDLMSRGLRAGQFREDAGPLAHDVPDLPRMSGHIINAVEPQKAFVN